MAYRRSITARFNLFSQHRLSPSFSHSHRHHNVSEHSETSPISRNPQVRNYIQHRFLGGGNNFNNYRRFAIPAGCGIASTRNYSNEAVNTEVLKEAVGVLGDKAPVLPVLPPEWVAAIDSLPPVVAFQHLIDYVHCFTGFNWWASIAATTIFIRFLMLPLDIYRTRKSFNNSYILIINLVKPHWDAIEKELSQNKDITVGEYWVKREALIKEHGVSPFQHLKGRLISVPVRCSIFLAVICMAAKDPSFKDGGALWFTDLTDHCDDFLLLLTGYIYMFKMYFLGIEPNKEIRFKFFDFLLLLLAFKLEAFPKIMKLKAIFLKSISLSIYFILAIYFVFTTSTLFSMVYEIVVKNSQVKKLLEIPIVPVELPSTNQKSNEGRKGKEKKR